MALHRRAVKRGLGPYENHVRLLRIIASNEEVSAKEILHHPIGSACSRLLQYLQG